MKRWLRMLFAELPLLRDLPALGDRPLPRVAAELGPFVPGWLLRLAAVAATAAMVALTAQRTTMISELAWTITGVAAVLMAALPSTVVAHAAVVTAGLFVALGDHGPFDPVVFGLIPLAYVAVRLAWWAERVSLLARVEVAALARGLPRGLVLTGATAGFGALVFLITGHPNPVAVVGGGLGLVMLIWLMLLRERANT